MRCGSGWTGRRVFRLRIPTWKNTIWRKLWDEHTKHEFATPDVDATLATRTVGDNRLVDEMVISFTHTIEMPWMLPNVKPTGRYVEVALVAIVGFRDGELAHENIYRDQASVLKQIGLLSGDGLPVYGVETAQKVLDLQG